MKTAEIKCRRVLRYFVNGKGYSTRKKAEYARAKKELLDEVLANLDQDGELDDVGRTDRDTYRQYFSAVFRCDVMDDDETPSFCLNRYRAAIEAKIQEIRDREAVK